MKGKEYVNVKNILDSFYNTPGELRIVSDDVLKDSIRKGVMDGIFGYGNIENGNPVCKYYKNDFTPVISENDIIIKPEICVIKVGVSDYELKTYVQKINSLEHEDELNEVKTQIPWEKLTEEQKTILENGIKSKEKVIKGLEEYNLIHLSLKVPSGKLSDTVRIVNYLKTKFENVNVKVEIYATKGSLKPKEYQEKIEEAIRQSGIEVENQKITYFY